ARGQQGLMGIAQDDFGDAQGLVGMLSHAITFLGWSSRTLWVGLRLYGNRGACQFRLSNLNF
ncbi:hypothetical protein, partial [Methylobacter sp.]|uniref:hypothetical protein n=1 Tax=Methylobacter sp. TaxID=2051955 RepID=UPI003DA36F5A